MKKVKKVLFVGMHNRFRSKVSEAIFDKLNKNKNFKSEGAGFLLDQSRLFVAPTLIWEMKKRGYKIKREPRQLTREIANGADIIVISADNVPEDFFFDVKAKIIKWDISDCPEIDMPCIKKTIDIIGGKVKKFVSSLK
ncbi:MAG TPA: hypothetical protein VJH92_01335 [Candidatus Nanoarchaeia archaeon]|nr:hypothetical protein [Candidatus Nanoarchaeia archaeon]